MNPALTIGQLAQTCGLSRATLLYYDRLRLLQPCRRSSSGYRLYAPAENQRLKNICFYRKLGVPLKDIKQLLSATSPTNPTTGILRHRLETLAAEIAQRQQQQDQIMQLLKQFAVKRPGDSVIPKSGPRSSIKENTMVNKQRWVEIMKAAGFTQESMLQWHKTFEAMEPEAHGELLESLGLNPAEITRIRQQARGNS